MEDGFHRNQALWKNGTTVNYIHYNPVKAEFYFMKEIM
jgi:hypothetical protein